MEWSKYARGPRADGLFGEPVSAEKKGDSSLTSSGDVTVTQVQNETLQGGPRSSWLKYIDSFPDAGLGTHGDSLGANLCFVLREK